MSKKIILTFDYELFFGISGSVENCILSPVDKLIDYFDRLGFKATFFIDTLFLERLINENEKTKAQYSRIEEQLIRLVSKGHRLELHIHPHWVDADYNKTNNFWEFRSYEKYKLSALNDAVITKMFNDSVQMVNNIARQAEPDYNVAAFRAGGWCVEPFSLIKEPFIKNKIYVDSSVVPGIKVQSTIHNLNYEDIPDGSFYRFEDDVRVQETNGQFIEVPITTFKINLFEKILNAVNRRTHPVCGQVYGDGEGIKVFRLDNTWLRILKMVFWKKEIQMFSIDGFTPTQFLIKKISKSKHSLITMISHPKTLTASSFLFLESASLEGFDFITIKELTERIIK